MRTLAAAVSFTFLLSAAAVAQPAEAPAGASATAQPQVPAQVSNPAQGAIPGNSDVNAVKNMPEEKIAPPDNGVSKAPAMPNMKVTKDSGGKTDASVIVDAPLADDYVMGKLSAPVTMIEYASMSCPHCAHFSATTMPEIEKKYIDTGKLRYILRPFPLNEPALKGAMLLDCVGQSDKSKYYVFAKVLFDAQSKWAFDGNWESGLETIATVGGLSKDQFEHCINNTDREMKILKIKKAATDQLRVPHTPYIFINNEVYDGDRSFEAMSKFIDAKLAQRREHK